MGAIRGSMWGMKADPLPTDEQRRALGQLLRQVLVFIRITGGLASQALADATHNLPADSWAPGVWNVANARAELMRYDARHPGEDFVAMFDQIFPPG
jgi:hypothetical protein